MELKNLKIRMRLIIGFSVMALLVILLGSLSVYYSYYVGGIVKDLYRHPFTVSNSVLRIKVNIFDIHRKMKDLALAENPENLEMNRISVDRIERETFREFDLIEERFLGEKTIVDDARKAFEDWAVIRSKVIELSRSGRYKEATEITQGEGARHVDDLEIKIQRLIDFATNKALEFRTTAENQVNANSLTLLYLLVGFLFTCIFFGILITRSITKPLSLILGGIRRIEMGDLQFEIPIKQKDEIGILADSFRAMQSNLQIKSDIAKAIAEGNLSMQVLPRSEKDTLAHSINQIIRNFSIVVEQANAVAAGDFRTEVDIRSEQDELGNALFRMKENLKDVVDVAVKVAENNFSHSIIPKSDRDELSISLNEMTEQLKLLSLKEQEQRWLKSGQAEFSMALQGNKTIEEMGLAVVRFITNYLGCSVGCLYLLRNGVYELIGSHALLSGDAPPPRWKPGEGLVGQAALEKQLLILNDLPEDYMTIASSTGKTKPKSLAILPCIMNTTVKTVLEVASLSTFKENQLDFLRSVADNLVIAIASAEARDQTIALLEQTQAQSRELKEQQEELWQINNELTAQTKKLQVSEEELKSQQEELMTINEELEEKNISLKEQKEMISQSNRELALASKYKSEFLANMSHELRTPLNSMLILSEDLRDDKEKGLTELQRQSAEIIYNSGHDLLKLINEILDLSKIESGKMDIQIGDVDLSDVLQSISGKFKRLAEEKGLVLKTQMKKGTPSPIRSDRQKLEQIISNLMSNAIKFTEKGMVSFTIGPVTPGNMTAVQIAVEDTGIGISPEKHNYVFEAFQQIDGGMSRKYGGTGLGLSIVKELVRLLGGEIRLESRPKEGSLFELTFPVRPKQEKEEREYDDFRPVETPQPSFLQKDPEEKKQNTQGDKSLGKDALLANKKILIVDDDMRNVFAIAKILEKKQMRVVKAANGEKALKALEANPDTDLVLMDLMMPVMDGLDAAKKIREMENFAKLPIIAVTAKAMLSDQEKCLQAGMNDYLSKPINIQQLLSLMRVWLYH